MGIDCVQQNQMAWVKQTQTNFPQKRLFMVIFISISHMVGNTIRKSSKKTVIELKINLNLELM